MTVVKAFKCPECQRITEIETTMQEKLLVICTECNSTMNRYLGGALPAINLGFQQSKHGEIEKFQFKNL